MSAKKRVPCEMDATSSTKKRETDRSQPKDTAPQQLDDDDFLDFPVLDWEATSSGELFTSSWDAGDAFTNQLRHALQ